MPLETTKGVPVDDKVIKFAPVAKVPPLTVRVPLTAKAFAIVKLAVPPISKLATVVIVVQTTVPLPVNLRVL